MIRINGGEMKGSRDRGYYLSFNIAGKSSPFLPRLGGKTGLGDFLITRGPRLLCCRPVCMCLYVPYVPLCEQKEKNKSQVMARNAVRGSWKERQIVTNLR